MSDIGVPNESALSYKNSHNAEQMCAKWRTLPFNGHFTPSQVSSFRGKPQSRPHSGKYCADADIPGFPASCKRENVAV